MDNDDICGEKHRGVLEKWIFGMSRRMDMRLGVIEWWMVQTRCVVSVQIVLFTIEYRILNPARAGLNIEYRTLKINH